MRLIGDYLRPRSCSSRVVRGLYRGTRSVVLGGRAGAEAGWAGFSTWLEGDPLDNSIKLVLAVVWLVLLADLTHAMLYEARGPWFLVGRILLLCSVSVLFVLICERFFRDELYKEPEH